MCPNLYILTLNNHLANFSIFEGFSILHIQRGTNIFAIFFPAQFQYSSDIGRSGLGKESYWGNKRCSGFTDYITG